MHFLYMLQAEAAEAGFNQVFKHGGLPDEIDPPHPRPGRDHPDMGAFRRVHGVDRAAALLRPVHVAQVQPQRVLCPSPERNSLRRKLGESCSNSSPGSLSPDGRAAAAMEVRWFVS